MTEDARGAPGIGWVGDQLVTDFLAAHLVDDVMGGAAPWPNVQRGRSFGSCRNRANGGRG